MCYLNSGKNCSENFQFICVIRPRHHFKPYYLLKTEWKQLCSLFQQKLRNDFAESKPVHCLCWTLVGHALHFLSLSLFCSRPRMSKQISKQKCALVPTRDNFLSLRRAYYYTMLHKALCVWFFAFYIFGTQYLLLSCHIAFTQSAL